MFNSDFVTLKTFCMTASTAASGHEAPDVIMILTFSFLGINSL